MSPEQAEQRLFGQALVWSETLPCSLTPGPDSADAVLRQQAMAERLLRSAVLAEGSSAEDQDHGAQDAAMQRMEAKLDLALDLLGRMLAGEQPQAPPRPVRCSRLGAQISVTQTRETGSHHLLSLQLPTGLSLPLRLPVEVLASAPGDDGHHALWLAFAPEAPALEAALERFLFRLHRRQIAASRRGPG